MNKAYLTLADGTVFCGKSFGSTNTTIGELVFTTGMNGYIETLTDPSYYGQIVMQTFPLIGNYGIIPNDYEGKCCVKGYIVKEYCTTPSNFRCEKDLDTFLKEQNITALCDIDTREITKIIREHGVMNATISSEIPTDLTDVKNYVIINAVDNVTCAEKCEYDAIETPKFTVVLIDYGVKLNIIRELQKRNCRVIVVPASFTAEDILALKPNGVALSNGPGDPSENTFQIETIRNLLGKVPIFGVCLGHQMLALANGATTSKLKYGHRGANQPATIVGTHQTYITSQNHGYAVDNDSVKNGNITYVNANDKTCEGIEYPQYNAFSVQFHPEACSGPHDTSFLFDQFINNMEG